MTKEDDDSVKLKSPFGKNRELVIHEMICAFNRQGFFSPNEIFSEKVKDTSSIPDGTNFQIVFQLSVPAHDFTAHDIIDQSFNMLFSTDGDKADLVQYMNDIKTGGSKYCKVIRKSLGI